MATLPWTEETAVLHVPSPKVTENWGQCPDDFPTQKVALALRNIKESQDALKLLNGDKYAGYGLVITHQDGKPYEERRHLAQKVEEDFFQKRQVAVKKIPRMKQRSLTSYCRKIPISPNFSLQPCRRKAPEICLLENCIIQQIPQKLNSLEPVSYTHLDVYKRQVVLLVYRSSTVPDLLPSVSTFRRKGF